MRKLSKLSMKIENIGYSSTFQEKEKLCFVENIICMAASQACRSIILNQSTLHQSAHSCFMGARK